MGRPRWGHKKLRMGQAMWEKPAPPWFRDGPHWFSRPNATTAATLYFLFAAIPLSYLFFLLLALLIQKKNSSDEPSHRISSSVFNFADSVGWVPGQHPVCHIYSPLSGLVSLGFPDGSAGEESTWNIGDTGEPRSIPRLGRSPGEGHGNPL